ncbi:MAG: MarR family transcriptional regulator [Thermoplasmata archaeon]|nr:MarR family transcriptional regulator [Thermoplasmata archaeon]
MHIHIATIGSSKEPVLKAFQALGFDRMYLLYSGRFSKEAEDVRESLRPFSVEVELVEVDAFEFQSVVDAIFSVCEKSRGKGTKISINITGGTNLMAAAACSCAFFVGATIYYVKWDDSKPVKDQVVEIPTPRTPDLNSLGAMTRKVFREICDASSDGGFTTCSAIAFKLKMTKQNASHHVGILEKEGLVQRAEDPEDSRQKNIKPTKQGYLIASWLDLREYIQEVSELKPHNLIELPEHNRGNHLRFLLRMP